MMRRPRTEDAWAIFDRYASDAEATRYMAWPVHTTINDTYAFLTFSDVEWERWPAGPYVIFSRANGTLLGSTGFAFETSHRAITGYILARDAWGQGYATESLRAMVELAPQHRDTRALGLDPRRSCRVGTRAGEVRVREGGRAAAAHGLPEPRHAPPG